ncbi:hypothetical protein L228DRAFT_151484 [Xylona heveae TC161]|uniref:Uncharacterized protein n=1 Tax=Xylona heveae (strain CBS 132557 / TC161) TaxID=1328760 RepID=A0A165GMP3_XYLHT|nr:hypothetical protein L228DRAFT_151484 [Xylona heveae TC161]KZF22380.1 hypothetical protein L228DRAFT_151484 [Xylona heveae TC161]
MYIFSYPSFFRFFLSFPPYLLRLLFSLLAQCLWNGDYVVLKGDSSSSSSSPPSSLLPLLAVIVLVGLFISQNDGLFLLSVISQSFQLSDMQVYRMSYAMFTDVALTLSSGSGSGPGYTTY